MFKTDTYIVIPVGLVSFVFIKVTHLGPKATGLIITSFGFLKII